MKRIRESTVRTKEAQRQGKLCKLWESCLLHQVGVTVIVKEVLQPGHLNSLCDNVAARDLRGQNSISNSSLLQGTVVVKTASLTAKVKR